MPSSEIRQRTQAVPWRNGIEAGCVIAGKGYEGNRILDFIRARGAAAVIPPKSNRPDLWEYDRQLYWDRNLIERAFDKLKHRRRSPSAMTAGASAYGAMSAIPYRP